MNIRPTRTVTIVDPREFDGDAYQVAARAIQQLSGLVGAAAAEIEPVSIMARNAELERLMAVGVQGDELRDKATAWPESPQGRQLAQVSEELTAILRRLKGLGVAVAFNPKAR